MKNPGSALRMDVLRAKSPTMALKELWAGLLPAICFAAP